MNNFFAALIALGAILLFLYMIYRFIKYWGAKQVIPPDVHVHPLSKSAINNSAYIENIYDTLEEAIPSGFLGMRSDK